MKIKLFFLIFGFLFLFSISGFSQSLSLIPNPEGLYPFFDQPIIYKNSLYTGYVSPNRKYYLVKFDGTNFTVFQNRDSADLGFWGHFCIFNDTLYFTYIKKKYTGQIAKFDGNTFTLYPNPDTSKYGFIMPAVRGPENLYWPYHNKYNHSQLAFLKGNKITLLDNPDSATNVSGYMGNMFKNELYLLCLQGGISHLAKLTGDKYYIFDNPSSDNVRMGQKINFNNHLYVIYTNNKYRTQLAEVDDSILTLIPNPDTSDPGLCDSAIAFKNNLYWSYRTKNSICQLIRFDGNNYTLINNPDTNGYMVYQWPKPIVFKDHLYWKYGQKKYGESNIVKYDGQKFTFLQNPFSGGGEIFDKPIEYRDSLYYKYNNYLVRCEDTSLTLIGNPDDTVLRDGFYGYYGNSIVYNDTMYSSYITMNNGAQMVRYPSAVNKTYTIKFIKLNWLESEYKQKISEEPLSNIDPTVEEETEPIKVFPNPAKGTVQITGKEDGIIQSVEVFDLVGKMIYYEQVDGKAISVDLSYEANGIYFIHVTTNYGMEIKKLMILM